MKKIHQETTSQSESGDPFYGIQTSRLECPLDRAEGYEETK